MRLPASRSLIILDQKTLRIIVMALFALSTLWFMCLNQADARDKRMTNFIRRSLTSMSGSINLRLMYKTDVTPVINPGPCRLNLFFASRGSALVENCARRYRGKAGRDLAQRKVKSIRTTLGCERERERERGGCRETQKGANRGKEEEREGTSLTNVSDCRA